MDWLSLFLALLIVATTYVLAMQGVFSALIMCVSVLLATAVAFATFEWIAMSFLLGPLGDMALPVAFIGTFVLPLLLLRLGLDKFITRSGQFARADRSNRRRLLCASRGGDDDRRPCNGGANDPLRRRLPRT